MPIARYSHINLSVVVLLIVRLFQPTASPLITLRSLLGDFLRLLPVLLLKLLTHITSLLSYALFTASKITERIEYKLLSLTYYKVFTTTQPPYLHNFIAVQPPRSTRSSSLVDIQSATAEIR